MVLLGYERAKANRTYCDHHDGALGMGYKIQISSVER
jgi:hypothetical protein